MRRLLGAALIAGVLLTQARCRQSPVATSTPCPGQSDPGRMTDRQLKKHGIGGIPERPATARENVEWALDHRRKWIEENYRGVVDVVVGEGWGVAYSNDQYGNKTYHRERDHMLVTIVSAKSSCPDPERGILFVIARDGMRVPVRFAYRPAK
jgi:hypothetical protein